MAATVIMVLGVNRSGSSCMAGVLSALGVPMGQSWIRPNAGNPKGFFEARGLRRLRKLCGEVEFPGKSYTLPFHERVAMLREWCQRRSHNAPVIGGKLPAMAMMVSEMEAAWHGHWKVIVTERPLADSAKSRHRWRRRIQSLPDILRDLTLLAEKRDADLAGISVPILRVQFSDLLRNPQTIIDAVIKFCGISPCQSQIDAALRFVDPHLNHHTKL
jgi:hypothetical protein